MFNLYQNLFKHLIKHPLNKQNKILTILNFVKWQIKLRLVFPNEIIVPFTDRSKFVVKKGRTGLTGNLYCGLHEFEDMMFLLHFLRKEEHFFDVGANVGSYSILSNTHVGARTTSFEPLPYTAKLLANNKANNGNNPNWKIEMMALSDKVDNLWFTSDKDTMNQIVNEDYSGEKVKVMVTCLDSYCKNSDCYPNLLKIDAEGFDEQVIIGGQETLLNPEVKAIIIESDTEIVKVNLEKSGFTPVIYDPFTREISQGINSGCNQIYVKDLEFTIDRIKTAERVHIKGYTL